MPICWDLVIFDWFVLSRRMQVILDSLFARPGSSLIWGGKKGEFRDWTSDCLRTELAETWSLNGRILAMLLSSAFPSAMLLKVFENQNPLQQQQQQILLKIRNISNYISFPRQIAYKVVEAGISGTGFIYRYYTVNRINEHKTNEYIESRETDLVL